MNCPKCGKSVPTNAAFCRYCGSSMGVLTAPAGKTCATCGTMLSANAKFCSKCGTRMDEQPKPLICTSCGAQLPSGSLFCNKCGGRVGQTPKISVCRSCGAQLAPDFLFCNLCGTPCAGVPATAHKDEKTEPISSSSSVLLTNTEPAAEPEILSADAVSAAEPVLVLSSDRIIEPEAKSIAEIETESISMTSSNPVSKPSAYMEAASQELVVEEASAKGNAADICPTCGKERIPGMEFCTGCGARLPQAEPVAVPASEPVQDIEPIPEPDIAATPIQELAFEEVIATAPATPAGDICPTCGKDCISGMAFCINCGTRLISPQTEPVVACTVQIVDEIESIPEPDIAATPMQELAFEEVIVPAPTPAEDVCPTCGKERIPGMAFCTGCGARLAQPEPAAASVTVIVPAAASDMPPVEFSVKPFVIERIQMPESEPEQPGPAWQSVCAACGMVAASGLRNCPRCGAKI